ncbi:MAG: IS5 family transposase [Anaerotignum sp.]|nr:IS5 family transposase [Anaerotignum sp.]
MRSFWEIDFLTEQVPDATTLFHFHHIIKDNKIGEKLFNDVKGRFEKAGLIMHGGSIVDATTISAPSSTKNKDAKLDPEMQQTKKGKQWYHGMKFHSGVDAGSGYVHTIAETSANVHDIEETARLIREYDEIIYGDSGYSGAGNRKDIHEDKHSSMVEFRTNIRPSSIKAAENHEGIH